VKFITVGLQGVLDEEENVWEIEKHCRGKGKVEEKI
jgi:hypothetical protein